MHIVTSPVLRPSSWTLPIATPARPAPVADWDNDTPLAVGRFAGSFATVEATLHLAPRNTVRQGQWSSLPSLRFVGWDRASAMWQAREAATRSLADPEATDSIAVLQATDGSMWLGTMAYPSGGGEYRFNHDGIERTRRYADVQLRALQPGLIAIVGAARTFEFQPEASHAARTPWTGIGSS